MRRFYCSYFDRNYLVRAIALIESLNRHEKNKFTFHAVCLDEITRLTLEKLALPNVVTVPIHEIEQRDFALLATKPSRTEVEYYWTCTPTIILRIMEMHPEIDTLTYLDADLCFFSSPDPIFDELEGHSVLIHEHRFSPSLAHLEAQSGRFNVGLMCFRRGDTSAKVLNWWRDRCIEWCYKRVENGKMGDQSYLNEWPSLFGDSIGILRNEAAGVAPWNHIQYSFGSDKSGNPLVNGQPLVFYHYHSLHFVTPDVVIPAGFVDYPISEEIIKLCFLPYLDALTRAIDSARSVVTDFAFGLINNGILSTEHTFIARKGMTQALRDRGVTQAQMPLDGNWDCYGSRQIQRPGQLASKPTAAAAKTGKPAYKVSAIVSTYNSEKFIRGCLDDLIAQTLYQKGGLEIVVVNTGSQQNEREIVEEYKQRFDHIKHIWVPQRENVYAAWNRGIKAASGEYVTNANTDDRHRPDALERMAGVLDCRPDIALVYADVDITTQENATFGGAPVKGNYHWLEFDRRTMFTACYMGPQPMWRRELHDRHGYFEPDFKSAGDYEFWLRMCPTETFQHIPETLGLYLESPSSIEHSNQETAARETLIALERHWPREWGRRPEPGARNAFAASQAKAQAQPDSGDIISQAMIIAARGDNKSARSLLWKAIEADPNRAQAYYNLAALLVKDGHVIDAADHACKAVEIDPTDRDAIEILTKVKTLLRATKPAPKAKSGKKAGKKGPSQADIDSKLRRINSLLSAAAPAKPKAASTDRKQTLSVCMIVRDEEAFIEDCLMSVRGLADEIVVVDTGSKDRTVDIARSHGASFHSFKWNGSFSDARNHALEHATCDWVLCLDADERLDANSRPIIEQAMVDSGVDAYDLTICSYLTDGPSPEVEISTRCSLFRRCPEYRFEGRVHEQVGRAVVASGGRAGRSQAVIYHHGYRPDVRNSRQKHKKYVELLRKEVEANPSDAYYLYHLGAELAAHGKHAEAVEPLAKAAELLPRGHNLAPLTFARLAESLMVTGDPAEAMRTIERAEALGIRHPQLSFIRGNVLRCLERWEEAVQAFETAVALGKQGLWDGDPSVYSHKAEYGLAACYLALGDCDAAAEHARSALQARPDNKDAAYILAKARELAKSPARKPAPAPKAQPKISLCMIARDEEAFIAQCLDSAKNFVDEIILVDTGSSDRTPEIAKSYGAKVYEFPWNDSYADARNESLKRASHEWILVLDADEKLDPATAHLLRREIANPRAEGYNMLFRNVMTDGVTPDITSHRVCRLFRNDPKYRYESRVHEHVENAITRNGGRVGQLDVLVHHYGYRTDIVAERGKHERYVRMLEAEVRDNPDDIFYLHHLSAALCAGSEHDRAIPHLQHACDIVTADSAFAPMVFSHLVNALREMNRLEEALEVVERAGKIGIKYPQLSFCEANVLLALNRPAEAIKAFEQAIAMGRGRDWTGDSGTVGYKADFGLASAYFMLGNHDRAIEYAESALAQKPGNVAALDLLARTYAITGNEPMQEKYLRELSAQLPGDPKPIIILGELYEKQGRPDEAARRFESLIDIGEETAALRVKLGGLAEARGLYDDAERQYLRAMSLDDGAPEIYNALGLLRAARSRYQEALDLFTKAIELAPASANAYFNAGDVLYSAGDYAQAADFYQAGLDRSPNHAPAFLRLGNCYFHTGVPQAAAMAYRQALAIDPGFADASNNLAMVEESLGAQAA